MNGGDYSPTKNGVWSSMFIPQPTEHLEPASAEKSKRKNSADDPVIDKEVLLEVWELKDKSAKLEEDLKKANQ